MQVRCLLTKVVCAALLVPLLTAQDKQQKIVTLEQQVQEHLQQQQPQLAIPLLREIVSLDPKNVNGQANLGVLLFFQDKFADAIPPLRAALSDQPNLWRIEALLGIAEKRTGDSRGAQSRLEQAFANVDDPKIKLQAGLELAMRSRPTETAWHATRPHLGRREGDHAHRSHEEGPSPKRAIARSPTESTASRRVTTSSVWSG